MARWTLAVLTALFLGSLHVSAGEAVTIGERQQRVGQALPMPEQTANELGYAALGKQRTAEAIALFERNAGAFPDSTNAADSLADACSPLLARHGLRSTHRRYSQQAK